MFPELLSPVVLRKSDLNLSCVALDGSIENVNPLVVVPQPIIPLFATLEVLVVTAEMQNGVPVNVFKVPKETH